MTQNDNRTTNYSRIHRNRSKIDANIQGTINAFKDSRIHLEQIEQLPRSFGIGSETKSGPLKIWTRAILPLKHTQTRVHWR